MPANTNIYEGFFGSVPLIELTQKDDYIRAFTENKPPREYWDGKVRGFLLPEGIMLVIPTEIYPL